MEKEDRIAMRKFLESLSDERLVHEAVYRVHAYEEDANKMLVQEVHMRDLMGKVEEKRIEKWSQEDKRREKKRKVKDAIRKLVFFVFLFFIFPVVCVFVANITTVIIRGEWEPSGFMKNLPEYSYEPVARFYISAKDWMAGYIKKIQR